MFIYQQPEKFKLYEIWDKRILLFIKILKPCKFDRSIADY